MLFNSIDFLIFFPIVAIVYFLIPRKVKYIWLLFASYYFYMCWNAKYALLIATSTIITYLAGIFIEKVKKTSLKKWIVALSFVSNLSILFLFKYFNFMMDTLNKVLTRVHINPLSVSLDLLLPVGISFYTFQALGYTIDVYRGNIKAEKNPLMYALFVSFFPQLVAGPIERSGNLLNQLRSIAVKKEGEGYFTCNINNISSGFTMMIWGLFMKMVIADRIAIYVDSVYSSLYKMGTVETVLAAIGFSIQIYCDFAGYSSIAIGAARVMNFNLMENFNTPYFATSISDFWKRWHISLSTWFRDYLYIPLGGNRKGRFRQYLNLMITFLVSGLWHGASWHFVIWGGIHGFYQIIGHITKPAREKLCKLFKVNTEVFSFRFGQMLITFCLTSFAWIFFKAGSINQVKEFLSRMFGNFNPWVLFDDSLYLNGLDIKESNILIVAVLVLLVVDLVRYKKKEDIGAVLLKQNLWFRWAVLILLIVAVIVFGEYGINFDSQKFIYFDF